MASKVKNKTSYKFEKGDAYDLDQIYMVQGLDDGDWWEFVNGPNSDVVNITRNVHFVVTSYEA